MQELGRQMVEHCAGSPLAFNLLAGILSKKHKLIEWETININAKKYINEGKIDGQQEIKYSDVLWVLGLSYDELPYQLKPCFLLSAHFPQNFEIRVKELCQMLDSRKLHYFSEPSKRKQH
ncbi:NB-ARC domain containing protein [Parasponia andersonii]|uniref:NB-ARC domain containing protein n=1 Tax=Parasponia andersonii TaxID=3476 RepID=A0A2P5D6V5_PARAD|nr:NB-ARC domain containing protein [Parasponia andersonii]